jgi:hypothetical protein
LVQVNLGVLQFTIVSAESSNELMAILDTDVFSAEVEAHFECKNSQKGLLEGNGTD